MRVAACPRRASLAHTATGSLELLRRIQVARVPLRCVTVAADGGVVAVGTESGHVALVPLPLMRRSAGARALLAPSSAAAMLTVVLARARVHARWQMPRCWRRWAALWWTRPCGCVCKRACLIAVLIALIHAVCAQAGTFAMDRFKTAKAVATAGATIVGEALGGARSFVGKFFRR